MATFARIFRSTLARYAIILGLVLGGLGAYSPSTLTGSAGRPPGQATTVDVERSAPIDCYTETQYDYEESYYDSSTGEYVTVYQVFERKCYDSGWDGSQQCGEYHFVGWDEVRTGGDDWGLGD